MIFHFAALLLGKTSIFFEKKDRNSIFKNIWSERVIFLAGNILIFLEKLILLFNIYNMVIVFLRGIINFKYIFSNIGYIRCNTALKKKKNCSNQSL